MLFHFKTKSFMFLLAYMAVATSYYFSGKTTDSEGEELNYDMVSPTDYFLTLFEQPDSNKADKAYNYIDQNWKDSYQILLIETAYFSQNSKNALKLVDLLEKKTDQNFGLDFDKWFQWYWNKAVDFDEDYYNFKAKLHKRIDSRFEKYFLNRSEQSKIRLDEVRWGGVLQDGIPPLRNPKMLSSDKANYLRDGATVFGIEVNGEARAYPKQILAWHELFTDTVGGENVAGVYCTLCGTLILYKSDFKGVKHQLGTSGFLYRSNKLMYDRATQSLWSTLEGEPVIGPLVGKGIKLEYLSVVTTTWGEWKKRHPDTKVLSMQTGHRRDYREGVAYQEYFATDDLMFTVPIIDKRLNNKDEVLAIRSPKFPEKNLAISSDFLRKNPVYKNQIGDIHFTVFTDDSGAHRVFKTKENAFKTYDGQSTTVDDNGITWTIEESKMVSATGEVFERLETFNAFWFGYQAAFPDVTLIK